MKHYTNWLEKASLNSFVLVCVIWVGVNRKKGYNIRKTHVFDSLNKVLLIAQNIRKAGELLVCFSDSIWSSIFYDVIRFQWYICSFVSFAFFSRCRCCSTKLCRNQFLSNNGTKCLHKRSYDWNGHWRWLMYFEFHLKKKRTNVRFCGRISYVNIFSSKNDYFSLYSQYKMSSGLGMKEKYGNILNA